MIALGFIEGQYKQHIDPYQGYITIKQASSYARKLKCNNQTGLIPCLGSGNAIDLKDYWKALSPVLEPLTDINAALEKSSKVVKALYECEEYTINDEDAFLAGFQFLVCVTASSPYYQELKSVLRDAIDRNDMDSFSVDVYVKKLYPNYQKLNEGYNEETFTIYFKALAFVTCQPLGFIRTYLYFLDFLDQAARGHEKSHVSRNRALLKQHLSTLPDDSSLFAIHTQHIPPWLYESAPTALWFTSSLCYQFGFNTHKNEMAAKVYAETCMSIEPEKGAILMALILMDQGKPYQALEYLDKAEKTTAEMHLLSADIRRNLLMEIKSSSRKGKSDVQEKEEDGQQQILDHYLKAGESGLAIGYQRAAEWLLETHQKRITQSDVWRQTADYYSHAAGLTASCDQLLQHRTIMSELCKAELKLCGVPEIPKEENSQTPQPKVESQVEFESCLDQFINSKLATQMEELPAPSTSLASSKKTIKPKKIPNPKNSLTFWTKVRDVNSKMNPQSDCEDMIFSAYQELKDFKINKRLDKWVKAMVFQNKAWSCKKRIEHLLYSFPETDYKRPRPLLLQDSLTRVELLNEGFQYVGRGLQTLGICIPPESIASSKVNLSKLTTMELRQFASLVDTLAHLYSHCGEFSKSKQLRSQYRNLYTMSHELRNTRLIS
ncbi:hypothetical protein [Endozoicomonas elysicola]|uniref:Uncharacterized protein n=1 Tax=Endozoicomonas elysicola TaxID=305900 RepID=A0A081KDE6_9GAMM|nr:hypothetical protein [Endozoicomonas elysicola]KEI72172.1 hypothetical protein GV64_16840 [Endozoicomonas elysicola]